MASDISYLDVYKDKAKVMKLTIDIVFIRNLMTYLEHT